MVAVHGHIQREGEVVHLVAQHLTDLSGELGRLSEQDESFPVPYGRGDQVRHGGNSPEFS